MVSSIAAKIDSRSLFYSLGKGAGPMHRDNCTLIVFFSKSWLNTMLASSHTQIAPPPASLFISFCSFGVMLVISLARSQYFSSAIQTGASTSCHEVHLLHLNGGLGDGHGCSEEVIVLVVIYSSSFCPVATSGSKRIKQNVLPAAA